MQENLYENHLQPPACREASKLTQAKFRSAMPAQRAAGNFCSKHAVAAPQNELISISDYIEYSNFADANGDTAPGDD